MKRPMVCRVLRLRSDGGAFVLVFLASLFLLIFPSSRPAAAQTVPYEPGLCELIRSSVKQASLQPEQTLAQTSTGPGAFSTLRRWCGLQLTDLPPGKGTSYVLLFEWSNWPDAQGNIGNKVNQFGRTEGFGDIAAVDNKSSVWEMQFARGCYQVLLTARYNFETSSTNANDIENAKRLAAALDERLKTIPTCKVEEESDRLPVIFLPGVAGTILTNSVGHELWPVAPIGQRANLAFEADGATSARGEEIKAGDVLRRPGMDFYGGFMQSLEKIDYKEGTDLFAFPYDWRYSNDVHFARLDQLIQTALEKSKKKKVILAAHSMGGVIARAYIYSSPQRAAKVSALITMGTPYWGAPKVYYGVTSGYQFGNPTVRQELMKVLLQNMPAAYQLLPQAPFITDKKTGELISLDMANSIRYKWFTKNTLDLFRDQYDETDGNDASFNPGLLKKAQEFYAAVGTRDQPRPLPAGVKQYAIMGTGVSTVTAFDMEDWTPGFLASIMGWKTYVELGDGRKVVMHPVSSDGDGTVPLWSLETAASTFNYYVPHTRSASAAHGDLPGNPAVQQIVTGILKNKPPNPQEFPRPQYWMGQPIVPGAVVEDNKQFELHSDAHLRITNSVGKALGFNSGGGIDESLPGTFLAYEGVEYASVSDLNDPVNVSVDGIRTGKFTLNVKTRKAGKQFSEFAYKEVPVVSGTKTQFTFTPGKMTEPPSLKVKNGGATTIVAPTVILASTGTGVQAGLAGGTGQVGADGTFTSNIPSVSGTVTSFRFFEGDGDTPAPMGLREYKTQFSRATLKAVYYELTIKYQDIDRPATFTVTALWRHNQKTVPFARQDLQFTKPADWNIGTRSYGYGNREPGKWESGTYTVEIMVNGSKVAAGSFVIN